MNKTAIVPTQDGIFAKTTQQTVRKEIQNGHIVFVPFGEYIIPIFETAQNWYPDVELYIPHNIIREKERQLISTYAEKQNIPYKFITVEEPELISFHKVSGRHIDNSLTALFAAIALTLFGFMLFIV